MIDIDTARKTIEGNIARAEADIARWRDELGTLEGQEVQRGWALALAYSQPAKASASGSTGERVACPYDASHGTYVRVNRHISEKHPGEALI